VQVLAGAADVLLEPAFRRQEGVADGHVRILVRVVVIRGPSNDDVVARNADVDADAVKQSLLVMVVWRLHRDPAAHDSVTDGLQFVDALSDVGLEGRALGELMEHDSK